MDNVLLIEPPFFRLYKETYSLVKFPLSLGYLAGAILTFKKDWNVKVINADFSPEDDLIDYNHLTGTGFKNYLQNLKDFNHVAWGGVKEAIEEFSPKVIGITAKSQNFAAARMIAKISKKINQDSLVVLGGPHSSMAKEQVLKDDENIDISVFGEGEETIVDILKYADGEIKKDNIPGIIHREKGKIVVNEKRTLMFDLEKFPFILDVAKKTLIDYEKYTIAAFRYLFALRGCPYNCSFCGSREVWTRKVRFRSVDNVIAEIKDLYDNGINYVHFDDDTFGIQQSWIKELCIKLKKECPNINFSCEIHCKIVNDEIIGLMKSAGCKSIQIGVESGSNWMLKKIRKGINTQDVLDTCKIIKKHKIHLQTFFIVGFPDETMETLNDTINFMFKIPVDTIIYSIFTPYYGTELFKDCEEKGIIPDNFDVSLYNHQSPENYFCPNIPKDIFIKKIRKLENKIDRINNARRIKTLFSEYGLAKVRERGVIKSAKRLCEIIFTYSRSSLSGSLSWSTTEVSEYK
jgi:radical SAM superfamily enzyme YgiQ (UPF0313 family)